MEKYEKREAHPMEKYIGRLVKCYRGNDLEVVGYSYREHLAETVLIIDASQSGGWADLDPNDVIFKECEKYWYVSINDLID